jgi:Protein of unknown function (DUF3892)
MTVRVTCIRKQGGYHDDPHVAIEDLGWTNEATGQSGRSTRLQFYDWLQNQNGVAYVKDRYGNQASVRPRVSARGNPFVQTVADGTPTDNLLNLPECV